MRPILNDGKLTVELTIPEQTILLKAKNLGILLETLHQPTGPALVAAVEAILAKEPT